MTAFYAKWKNEKLAVVVHVSCSRCCLTEDGTENHKSSVYNARAQPFLLIRARFHFGGVLFSLGKIVLVKNSVR